MAKSLIAQIAEIQKQYDRPLYMTNYQTKERKTMFMFDMGDYSSVDTDPDVALQNLISIINEREIFVLLSEKRERAEQAEERRYKTINNSKPSCQTQQ